MRTYKHEIFRVSELEVVSERYKWVEDRLNEIAYKGGRLVCKPDAYYEPSELRLSDGRPVNYFVLTVLVEYEIPADPIEPAPSQKSEFEGMCYTEDGGPI